MQETLKNSTDSDQKPPKLASNQSQGIEFLQIMIVTTLNYPDSP